MLVGHCAKCNSPITDAEMKSGQGAQLGNDFFCKDCAPSHGSQTVSTPAITADEPDEPKVVIQVETNKAFLCGKCGQPVEDKALTAGHGAQLGDTVYCRRCAPAPGSGTVAVPAVDAHEDDAARLRPSQLFSCAKCGKPVSDAELNAGLGGQLGDLVYCRNCAPAQGSGTVSAPAVERDEPPPAKPAMGFYFCEDCGKRVTESDLKAGQGRNKQMKGVFCRACSEKVLTVQFEAVSADEDEPAPRKTPAPSRPKPTATRNLPAPVPFGKAAVPIEKSEFFKDSEKEEAELKAKVGAADAQLARATPGKGVRVQNAKPTQPRMNTARRSSGRLKAQRPDSYAVGARRRSQSSTVAVLSVLGVMGLVACYIVFSGSQPSPTTTAASKKNRSAHPSIQPVQTKNAPPVSQTKASQPQPPDASKEEPAEKTPAPVQKTEPMPKVGEPAKTEPVVPPARTVTIDTPPKPAKPEPAKPKPVEERPPPAKPEAAYAAFLTRLQKPLAKCDWKHCGNTFSSAFKDPALKPFADKIKRDEACVALVRKAHGALAAGTKKLDDQPVALKLKSGEKFQFGKEGNCRFVGLEGDRFSIDRQEGEGRIGLDLKLSDFTRQSRWRLMELGLPDDGDGKLAMALLRYSKLDDAFDLESALDKAVEAGAQKDLVRHVRLWQRLRKKEKGAGGTLATPSKPPGKAEAPPAKPPAVAVLAPPPKSARKPKAGMVYEPDKQGLIRIETEHYQRLEQGTCGVKWTLVTSGPHSGKGSMQALPNGDDLVNAVNARFSPRLDYKVLLASGTYYVWICADCPDSRSNSVHVGLNLRIFTVDKEKKKSGGLSRGKPGWTRLPETMAVSRKGTHTLNVWMREDGVKIDRIILTQNRSYKP